MNLILSLSPKNSVETLLVCNDACGQLAKTCPANILLWTWVSGCDIELSCCVKLIVCISCVNNSISFRDVNAKLYLKKHIACLFV